ncbi:MAG: HAMP domain-containing sensor histidine kinase, partial [Ignavibacteria bacterium]|nr:HAMP domain-containing sensor histidine kinase [Ignavibacteria bacterium]
KLFSIIAHDLRGPIGAFINLTEMFMDDNNVMTNEEMIEIGRGMNKSAISLHGLLDNLLHWSRIQREEVVINKTDIYIKALAAEVIEIYKPIITKKSLHVNNIIPEDLIVLADSNMIQMVLRNLVSNALKFTPKGGAVLISAVVNSDQIVSIHVRDNGIGIPAQMIEQLYNFSQSTGRIGTDGEPTSGLGLKLCKEFVERNGGSLHVISNVEESGVNEENTGKGTDFYFTLPGRKELRH